MAQQQNSDNQEIDLIEVKRIFRSSISKANDSFFNFFLFIKRNIIIIGILFILGAMLGFFIDKNKSYDHQLIVIPNFRSVDYLYSKIELLNSKIKERDTFFIKEIGIKNPKKFYEIKIEPITDVYDFVNERAVNYEMIKLMAEDGSMAKVIEDPVTSKYYRKHIIKMSTGEKIDYDDFIKPITQFLNNSEYYTIIQKEYLNNLQIKMKANDSIISQIDGILAEFGSSKSSKGDKLMFYNENAELNEIINTKDRIINEQASLRVTSVDYTKIIKDYSNALNIQNNKGLNGKMKFVLPILFVLLFMGIMVFRNYVRKQLNKRKAE